MSARLPNASAAASSRWRSRAVGLGILGYAAILATAFATRRGWLCEIASLLVASLLLAPGLRRRSLAAWTLWSATVVLLAALALRGRGEIALDLLPAIVNAALCLLFARTLAPGREPLIARLIGAIEGPSRLALPGVAVYARRLTIAWSLLLGAQAIAVLAIAAFATPDGVLAAFGMRAPLELRGAFWQGCLHVGGYAGVLLFFALEYAFRRWHLRDIPHVPPVRFVAELVRRWPALARSFADDVPKSSA